jgi:Fe-S-cluster-containing dehydrogenase component
MKWDHTMKTPVPSESYHEAGRISAERAGAAAVAAAGTPDRPVAAGAPCGEYGGHGEATPAEASDATPMGRNRFLAQVASMIGLGALAMPSLVRAGLEAVAEGRTEAADASFLNEGPEFDEDEAANIIVRMQRELRQAMRKPIAQRKWVMVIDLRKCTGCGACTISCIAENHLPAGVVYRPVMEEELGTYPNVSLRSTPRPCMQCESAPCVPVCPVRATWIRPDGIIDMDYNQCIGCRYCMTACPYHARTFDFGYYYTEGTPAPGQPYEQVPNFEYGKRWEQRRGKSPTGNVRKCHFCTHKLDAGMLPSCVTTCIGYATYFGDANDPDGLVSELISRGNKIRLKEEMGTRPRVYYLI